MRDVQPVKPPEGAAYEVRYSAKLLRERRRTERFGGLIGIVASVGSLVEAGLAIQHGVMVVDLGPSRGFLKVPVWIDIPVSLLMLCASVWVVWGSQRGRKES